jgi:hypothetical protein
MKYERFYMQLTVYGLLLGKAETAICMYCLRLIAKISCCMLYMIADIAQKSQTPSTSQCASGEYIQQCGRSIPL